MVEVTPQARRVVCGHLRHFARTIERLLRHVCNISSATSPLVSEARRAPGRGSPDPPLSRSTTKRLTESGRPSEIEAEYYVLERHLPRIVAIGLLVYAACILANAIVLEAAAGDTRVSRDELEEQLSDIHDNRGTYLTAVAIDLVGNTIALSLAVGLFGLFRNRDRGLAALGSSMMSAAAVLLLLADVGFATLSVMAEELADGADSAAVTESAWLVSRWTDITALVGLSIISVGIVSYGFLLALAASADDTPRVPRWVGWVAIAGAPLVGVGAWLGLASESLIVVELVGLLLAIVFITSLGGWLLFGPQRTSAAS